MNILEYLVRGIAHGFYVLGLLVGVSVSCSLAAAVIALVKRLTGSDDEA